MSRIILICSLILPLACIDTARNNPKDPAGNGLDANFIDAGNGLDANFIDAGNGLDANFIDAGNGLIECTEDNLLPCYLKYRAAQSVCVHGQCTISLGEELDNRRNLKGLLTSSGLDARTACAVACNPDYQPGLCTFNFNDTGIDFATCFTVGEPAQECPAVLEPEDDINGANHGVCRIPCDPSDSVCSTETMNDSDNDGAFTFQENCSEELRCGNTGRD